MSSKLDLERLKKDHNYYLAKEILVCIIEGICPEIKVLEKLYGSNTASQIRDIIKKFLGQNISGNLIPRKHAQNPATEIFDARTKVESNKHYQLIHSQLLNYNLPDINNLDFFYGSYSSEVFKIFKTYLNAGLKRKCDLSAVTHLHRVGAVVFEMGLNDDHFFKYSTIGALHDSIEDLLNLVNDENDNSIGILNYKKFLDEFLPSNLQSSIKTLTNHYDLILQFVVGKLKAEDKALTIRNIQHEIKKLLELNIEEINIYVRRMKDLLDNTEFLPDEDIFLAAKWACYKTLYLDNIAFSSKENDDYRLFEIKGIDLSDNSHGKDALSIESKIRNIIKNTLWGTKGYALHSTWIPLNRHIEEILEDSLCAAECIILKDLLENQSYLDFIMSALIKFKKLEMIFYV
jgi:hypothetical protein